MRTKEIFRGVMRNEEKKTFLTIKKVPPFIDQMELVVLEWLNHVRNPRI